MKNCTDEGTVSEPRVCCGGPIEKPIERHIERPIEKPIEKPIAAPAGGLLRSLSRGLSRGLSRSLSTRLLEVRGAQQFHCSACRGRVRSLPLLTEQARGNCGGGAQARAADARKEAPCREAIRLGFSARKADGHAHARLQLQSINPVRVVGNNKQPGKLQSSA